MMSWGHGQEQGNLTKGGGISRRVIRMRKKAAILFGGKSTEYEVSLQSASAVIAAVDEERFEKILIGIDREGRWYRYYGDVDKIMGDKWCNETDCVRAVLSPDRETGGLLEFHKGQVTVTRLDMALPVLHGKNGEDGTVQGLIELAGIRLVGCNTLCSALCMDKDRAHKLAGLAGVEVPASVVFARPADAVAAEEEWKRAAREIGYPLFVKPVRAGSSFGVTKVKEERELAAAVRDAFCHDEEVIMEEAIEGFEVGCAVMGEREPIIGEVDEIELTHGFFDYTEKYTLKSSRIYVPARIGAETAARIKETAKVIYRALGCSGFARVDMFLTPEGRVVFNEVNTIPGFTSHSRFPSMMKAAGVSFEEVVNRLLDEGEPV